ncbi:MAG: hypothetical protein ACXVRI_01570, partial [Gaiellaceae bacterium]
LLSGGFIAGGIALVPIAANQSIRWLQGALAALSLSLLVLAGATLMVYLNSTNPPYPFIDSDADVKKGRWKWFYWDALPDASRFADVRRLGGQSKKAKAKEVQALNDQYPQFVQRTTEGLSNELIDSADDLRQLYTLHINERYKNQYLTKIRRVLKCGLLWIPVLVVAAALISASLQSGSDTHSSRTRSGRIEIIARWRERDETQATDSFRVRLQVNNLSKGPVDLTNLEAVDEFGFTLPTTSDLPKRILPPRTSRSFAMTVTAPKSYSGRIAGWEIQR